MFWLMRKRFSGVVFLLDLGQPLVVVAIARLDPFLALVHHEVDVGAAGRLGLFTVEQYLEAFRAASLEADHDPEGPMGRGLYIATA